MQRVDGGVGGHRQPPRQLVREQHVGQLALPVRRPTLVVAPALQVIEVDVAVLVRQRRDVDDAARPVGSISDVHAVKGVSSILTPAAGI
jgi:hypothetical protein